MPTSTSTLTILILLTVLLLLTTHTTATPYLQRFSDPNCQTPLSTQETQWQANTTSLHTCRILDVPRNGSFIISEPTDACFTTRIWVTEDICDEDEWHPHVAYGKCYDTVKDYWQTYAVYKCRRPRYTTAQRFAIGLAPIAGTFLIFLAIYHKSAWGCVTGCCGKLRKRGSRADVEMVARPVGEPVIVQEPEPVRMSKRDDDPDLPSYDEAMRSDAGLTSESPVRRGKPFWERFTGLFQFRR